MIYPDIFTDPSLIGSREPRDLVADGLMAWAVCICGNPPPKNFGEVLVEVRARIGMSGASTAENLTAFARGMGWLTNETP